MKPATLPAMATVSFPVWGTMYPEAKPILQYQQLRRQDTSVLAGDRNSGYALNPQEMPLSSIDTAIKRARCIAAHEG